MVVGACLGGRCLGVVTDALIGGWLAVMNFATCSWFQCSGLEVESGRKNSGSFARWRTERMAGA